MTGQKDRNKSEAGYQPQKVTNESDAKKGYQPKGKPTESQLNPPTGGSNVQSTDQKSAKEE